MRLLVLLILISSFVTVSCGVKGPPLPPEEDRTEEPAGPTGATGAKRK